MKKSKTIFDMQSTFNDVFFTAVTIQVNQEFSSIIMRSVLPRACPSVRKTRFRQGHHRPLNSLGPSAAEEWHCGYVSKPKMDQLIN